MVAGESGFVSYTVEHLESGGGTLRKTDGYGAVECDDGRRADLKQSVVEKDDALPVGLFGCASSGVAGGDRGLQSVVAGSAAELLCVLERGHSSLDLRVVPEGAVLLVQQNGFSVLPFARRGA